MPAPEEGRSPAVSLAQRDSGIVVVDGGGCCGTGAGLRLDHGALSHHPSFLRLVWPHAGELCGALRAFATEIAERPVRDLQAAPFVEHQSYLFQPADFSSAAPLGPSCQRPAALPDSARFRRSAAPAQRLSGLFRTGRPAPAVVKVMDSKLMQWAGGDITLVNVDPSERERLYSKFGAASAAARLPG